MTEFFPLKDKPLYGFSLDAADLCKMIERAVALVALTLTFEC